MTIALVGCGFLGSIFAEEFAKRQFAFDDVSEWTLVDSDSVEQRNCANQNFDFSDVDGAKVDAVSRQLRNYTIPANERSVRLDKSNVGDILDEAHIIVSAVDNLPTRELLWYYAKERKLPLLHLGVSQQGTGNVDWTVGRYDTWTMSPLLTLGQQRKLLGAENIPRELKPCELIAFRGLGLNVGIAAAKALGIFMGFDPEKVVNEKLGFDVLPRTASTWNATNEGHKLIEIKELTEDMIHGKA